MAAESPVAVEVPSTYAELLAIVKAAARRGRRVKAVGSGHAVDGSAATDGPAATDGIAISLANFDRVLRVDRENRLVTVQAGIGLGRLNVALAARNLALADFGGGGGTRQSVGSAVATGVPGTGAGTGGLSTQVVGLDLVTADGSVVACSATEEPEIFAAARVSLGALGVVATVTLQCVTAFNLSSVTERVEMAELLRGFDAYMDGNDHVEFSWLPHTRRAWVRCSNHTDEPGDGRRVDRGYRALARSRRFRWEETEYSVPRAVAVPLLREVTERLVAENWAPFPIRVGVAAADDIPLSPATGRPSVFIAMRRGPGHRGAVADIAGARPQWSQARSYGPASLRSLYPQWDAWQAVRHRLDPEGRLANGYTRNVLG